MRAKHLIITIAVLFLFMSLAAAAVESDARTTLTLEQRRDRAIEFLRKHKVNETPIQHESINAIYRLSEVEKRLYSKDFKRCIDEASELEKSHPSKYRELGTALYWKGYCLRRMGKTEEAHKVFEKIRLEIPGDAPQYPGINFKAQALYDLALYYRDMGDRLNEDAMYERIVERYPDSEVAKTIQKRKAILPELKERRRQYKEERIKQKEQERK